MGSLKTSAYDFSLNNKFIAFNLFYNFLNILKPVYLYSNFYSAFFIKTFIHCPIIPTLKSNILFVLPFFNFSQNGKKIIYKGLLLLYGPLNLMKRYGFHLLLLQKNKNYAPQDIKLLLKMNMKDYI